MSARRDALLFFAMALVPSIAIGLLGQRAIKNEGAARERELTVSAAQEANAVARRIQDGVRDHARRIDVTSALAAAAATTLYERARQAAPSFAEPVVVASDGRLLLPRVAPRAGDADTTCQTYAVELERMATRALRSMILARCEDARDQGGRWLWPVLALDALAAKPNDVLFARLLTWLETHAARMSTEEVALTRADGEVIDAVRTGARADIERALAGGARPPDGDAGVAESAESSDAFRAAVRSAVAAPGVPESFSGDANLGVIVASSPDTALGFIVNRDSILRDANALAVSDARFIASLLPQREVDAHRGPESFASVADGLGVMVRLRDPDSIARERRLTEGVLYGLLTIGVGLASVLSFALFRRMRETRRTSELRTSFVAGVSHELRTPLASIRMLSELLSEGRVEAAERREVLDALTNETVRLTTTVERFLAYAKSERGKLVAEKVVGDLAVVVRERVEAFRARSESEVELELDHASMRTFEAIAFDRRQIEIVLDNLLENAKKYAPLGEPYRVAVGASDEAATISVDDAGAGVDTAVEKRIFRAFERGDDRLSSAVSGTGLGLFLVRTIADAHGGAVRVTRSGRGGARFTVTLPRS